MHRVAVSPKAAKALNKIEKKHQRRIGAALVLLQSDPLKGKPLTGKYTGTYSLRVWPYRVIYLIEKKKKLIYVISIGHRQGI